MKRLWIAAAMLIIIAAIIVSGVFAVRLTSTDISDLLDSAEKYAINNDLSSAAKVCHTVEKKWEEYERILRIYVNSSEISEIGLTITQLAPFAENDETGELIAQINVARIRIIHMGNMESIGT